MTESEKLMQLAGVHPEWQEILAEALGLVERDYLASLLADERWLPGPNHLLAAFRRDRHNLRYLLLGESPYPRRESANGIAFYDAAVGSLWSDRGLSKAVNRATSLRNIVKAALLADGRLVADADGRITQEAIAAIDRGGLVDSLDELFANLQAQGWLMLNATPVLHPERKPAVEARYWQAFLERLLTLIIDQGESRPTLLLWGKIAALVEQMPASANYHRLVCEHPYNLSFIDNPQIQALFREIAPLRRSA